MKKNELTGAVREVKGKAQKEAGKATGNPALKAHGESEESKGRTTRVVGRAEGKVDAVKADVKQKVNRATR
ncbi:MAG TPA: CsbD family protein [Chloroflexota bacterium]|nr:CsbD family protein [Chloroflexota bacterium]